MLLVNMEGCTNFQPAEGENDIRLQIAPSFLLESAFAGAVSLSPAQVMHSYLFLSSS